MFVRSGQFPGYVIRETLDAPRQYERYLATVDNNCSQWRVIYSLNRELAGIAELRNYFQHACREMSRFRVNGLVPICEIGMSRSQGVFVVYPYDWAYLSVGELSFCSLRNNISVAPTFVISTLLDAVRILDSAYAQGCTHFSVLPSHICLSSHGVVYVRGFIEAAMRRKFHMSTELNAKFDAPEWRRNETPSLASDVYAIGALLFQALTNEYQPDEWEPGWTIMMDILSRAGIPGEALGPCLDFFYHTLAERPQQRYASYGQLAQALEMLLAAFGSYRTCQEQAGLFAGCFDDYPPQVVADSAEFRSDVINLITGDELVISAELPKTPEDGQRAISAIISNARRESSGCSSSGGDISFEDTLTSPSQSAFETRVVHRSSNSFRTINPDLRSSVNVSPVEVLARSRYQILDQLGNGGTGTVYKVLDTTLSEVLALKVLRPELTSDSAWLERFKRELKITRDLEHSCILQAYHLEQLEGLYFYTMRYIDGKNLSEILHESPLPLMMTLRIMTQIAEALVAAHDRGIIHRDLKPANIMIDTRTYHPYLMDFGIAGSIDMPISTIDGQGIGTPFYMAPEQSRGEPLTVLADVYSFGIVCYECFTQKLPYSGQTAVAIYKAQMSGVFEPIRSLNPIVPPAIAQIVESCIRPNPADRPASIRVVLDGLGRMG